MSVNEFQCRWNAKHFTTNISATAPRLTQSKAYYSSWSHLMCQSVAVLQHIQQINNDNKGKIVSDW